MTFTLQPQDKVGDAEVNLGLRMLLFDGVCSQVMGILTGGAFLVAFALLLGASDLTVGVLAALGPLTQMLQIPAIYLVERTGHRKALVVWCAFLGRLFFFLAAALPWLAPEPLRVPLLIFALLMYFGLGTVSGLSWSSWMRDLIPDAMRGRYMSKRMALTTAVAAIVGLLAGIGVDLYKGAFSEIGIYSIYMALGGVIGLLGTYFLGSTPEPRMVRNPNPNLLATVAQPFKDQNFRKLLIFLGSWSFAVNLAAPFFTVYMLRRLHYDMLLIVVLAVLSQLVHVLFVRLWGKLADRFSYKSVLVDAGPLFILVIALWPFTTMPEVWAFTLPLLIMIHVLSGVSTAGVQLCTENIAAKLSPRGEATSYLAANALVAGVMATIAPILGGLIAMYFADKELKVSLQWISMATGESWELPTFDLRGLDFLFLLSFVFGLYALHRLLAVREDGDVEKGVVTAEFRAEVNKAVRSVSNVAGLRDMFAFPYNRLLDAAAKRKS